MIFCLWMISSLMDFLSMESLGACAQIIPSRLWLILASGFQQIKTIYSTKSLNIFLHITILFSIAIILSDMYKILSHSNMLYWSQIKPKMVFSLTFVKVKLLVYYIHTVIESISLWILQPKLWPSWFEGSILSTSVPTL